MTAASLLSAVAEPRDAGRFARKTNLRLPAAGLALRNEPAEEGYRRVPAEIGWERFDLLRCLPVT